MKEHIKEVLRLTYLKTKRGLPWAIILAIVMGLFVHNSLIEKVFIHKLYSAPHTREAREQVRDFGLRMVTFATDPYRCATDIEYAALIVINPNKLEFNEDMPGWENREEIDKNIKESCQ